MKLKLSQLLMCLLITGITIFFMRDLFKPGLPKWHDSNPHVARMVAYHTALKDGQYPPMWAKELLGGIGSPVMMLNYQLPYIFTEAFVQAGVSVIDSYKWVIGLSFVVSGVLMYLALKTRYSLSAAVLGSLIYVLAPYRFLDIFVRGALGESLSFIFPPLLIWGFSKKSWPLLILGWAGLFLTHPTASALFSAFFLGYILLSEKRVSLWPSLKIFFGPYLVALFIAAFNILPTLALTKYTYYSPTLSDTLLMFPSLTQLIHSPWGYGVSLPGTNDGMSFELGAVQWIVLLSGLIYAGKKNNQSLRYLVLSSLVVMVLILPISIPVYKLFHLTSIIDFPWRLLLCLVFTTAWIGAELLTYLTNRRLKYLITGMVVVTLITQSLPIAHTNFYWHKPLAWFARETGDSYGEYAPLSRATRDSAPFWKRAEFVEGSGVITELIQKSNDQKYLIESEGEGVIRINTAYFPGWKIPDTCSVTKRTLTHIDDSGLIGCKVQKGEQVVEIKFEAPPVQKAGNLVTLAGIGIYLWILFRSFYPHSMKKTP